MSDERDDAAPDLSALVRPELDRAAEPAGTPRGTPEPAAAPGGPPPSPSSSPADSSDVADGLTFDEGRTMKIGLLGGRQVGKTYLFQSIVYRVYGEKSASLTSYLSAGNIEISSASSATDPVRRVAPDDVIRDYREWRPLLTTVFVAQRWYRLRLHYRTGWLGWRESPLDLSFLDGSGEYLASGAATAADLRLWSAAFLDARVMVFCLPYWAAFPDDSALSDEDWKLREEFLRHFDQVVTTYTDFRAREKRTHPVRTVLALTMADDRRGGLPEVRAKWIDPYLDDEGTFLERVRTGRGVAQYLANARLVSRYVRDRFARLQPHVARLPGTLTFGGSQPWLIPLSATSGSMLARIASATPAEAAALRREKHPVPAHVDLPLLLALCDQHNALM